MTIVINAESICQFVQNIATINEKAVIEKVIQVTSDLLIEFKTFPQAFFKIVMLGKDQEKMIESLRHLALLTQVIDKVTETSLSPVPLPVAWKLLLQQTGRIRIYFDRLNEAISYHESTPKQHILVLQILIKITEISKLATVVNRCFIFVKNRDIESSKIKQFALATIYILDNSAEVLFKQYVKCLSQPLKFQNERKDM